MTFPLLGAGAVIFLYLAAVRVLERGKLSDVDVG